jgi:hypothetical protein
VDGVARVVGVEEARVELANTRETVFNHPITPADASLAVASLSPCPPDRVSKHRAKSSGVGKNVGDSTNQMVEIIDRRSGKVQLIVNIGNSSEHRGAIAKDVKRRVVRMRAKPTTKVGPMSPLVCENHVVSD